MLQEVGYTGSHTIVELIKAGYGVVVVDSLVNSLEESLRRVGRIRGSNVLFFEVDIRNRVGLTKALNEHSSDVCIHFTGLKAVDEYVSLPWKYYENNVNEMLVVVMF